MRYFTKGSCVINIEEILFLNVEDKIVQVLFKNDIERNLNFKTKEEALEFAQGLCQAMESVDKDKNKI